MADDTLRRDLNLLAEGMAQLADVVKTIALTLEQIKKQQLRLVEGGDEPKTDKPD